MSWIEIKKKNEERAKELMAAREIVANAGKENRSITPEENEQFNKRHENAERLAQEINLLQTQENAERSLTDQIGRESVASTTDDTHRRAVWNNYVRHGILPDHERVLLSETGWTPQGFHDSYIEVLAHDAGVIEAGAEIIETPIGGDYVCPRLNDTANTGELIAQGSGTVTEDVEPTDDYVLLKAYEFSSKALQVSLARLRDDQFDAESYLGVALARRIAKAFNTYATTGTGTDQPQGVATSAVTTGHTTAAPTAISYVDWMTFLYSVNPWYRTPESVIVAADSTFLAARKLTDTAGQPLWQPNLVVGEPETLSGFRIVRNPNMPAIGSGNVVAVFGLFRELSKVRRVRGVTLHRLNETYIKNLNIGFIAHASLDHRIGNTAAGRKLVCASS